jgi:hypothetical protein
MNRIKAHALYSIICIIFLTGCGGDTDPYGKFLIILLVPAIGLVYFFGYGLIYLFQSRVERKESVDGLRAFFVGLITALIIYKIVQFFI